MLKTLVACEVGVSLRHRNEDSAQRLGSGPRCGPVASSGSCGPVTGSTVFLAGLMPLIARRSAREPVTTAAASISVGSPGVRFGVEVPPRCATYVWSCCRGWTDQTGSRLIYRKWVSRESVCGDEC